MKKTIAWLLVLVTICSLCGCGNGGGNTAKEFVPGVIEDGIYTNEFVGLGFKLPSGWRYYNAEEMEKLNQDSEETGVVFDMFAANNLTFNNVSINVEKMDAEALEALNLSEKIAVEAETLGDSLQELGYADFEYQLGMAKVNGEMFNALYSSAKIQEQPMYQLAFQKKCDGYLATVTITTFFTDTRQEVLGEFYLLH